MHINDSLCPPPMQWGAEQGKSPRPHAGNGRSMYTSLIASCPVAMGWGMGGVYSPFLLALVPPHQVTMVELRGWRP